MAVSTLVVGDVRLTRVSYAEVDLPAETFGLSPDQIAALGWAEPVWANGGQVRAAAAAWIIEQDDARIVLDPAQAADDILRTEHDAALHQEAFAALLADAGFARESITHAVATHIEGIGMFAWRNDDGTWAPFFPNAPLMYSQRELDALDRGEHVDSGIVLAELRAAGAVKPTSDREQLTRDVSVEVTGAHSQGHQIIRIESQGERAVFVGHLAVAALHVATGPCPDLQMDAESSWRVLSALRDEGALLIGPLWPAPGAARWNGAELIPA